MSNVIIVISSPPFHGILDDVVKMNPLMRAHYIYQLSYPFYTDSTIKNGAIPEKFEDDLLYRANARVCYFMLGSQIFMRSIEKALFYDGTTSNTNTLREHRYVKPTIRSQLNKQIKEGQDTLELCKARWTEACRIR